MHTHGHTHTHIQKYILNKSPVLVGGGLGREGGGICFNLGELKKGKKKRNPSVFLNRCCCLEVEVVFHCTGRNLSNNNNKLLELGLKRFRCTFFI